MQTTSLLIFTIDMTAKETQPWTSRWACKIETPPCCERLLVIIMSLLSMPVHSPSLSHTAADDVDRSRVCSGALKKATVPSDHVLDCVPRQVQETLRNGAVRSIGVTKKKRKAQTRHSGWGKCRKRGLFYFQDEIDRRNNDIIQKAHIWKSGSSRKQS